MSETDFIHCYRHWIKSAGIGVEFSAEQLADYKVGIDCYQNLCGALISMFQRIHGHPPQEGLSIEANEHLALFLHSLPLLECAIVSNNYPSFAALAKMAIDGISTAQAHLKGNYKQGRTPNANNTQGQSVGQLLKTLQPVAHLADTEIVGNFAYSTSGDTPKLSWIPEYRDDAFQESLIGLIHILCIAFALADKVLNASFRLEYSENERKAFEDAVKFLKDEYQKRSHLP